ncbi:hypothetical protein MSTO_03680 [Mycobacterium stomatepiae]|uniref:2,4-diaminopentanoate dehydrogenase C-terminal domain-containing protein n=1 Tax=Mycobacterium stomatepiae TaxID=470076 RepID=A0A7I7Q1H7_9MYCO|nr:hypothetical protein MSTO_03680 [Mycobacterium stomatepiae]
MRRVIQFSTGNVGRHSLRAIIGRPDLELVGVHAARPDKVGRDAAQLCGLDAPTGIVATDDVDALVNLGADCVVYTSQGETRPTEAIEQMSKFLAAGTNVVGTSMVWLVTPHHAEDWLRKPLQRACAAGNTSLYVNGIDPGFSGDTLVHAAVSLTTRVDSITVQEIFDCGNYDDAEFTGAAMGFGSTEDDDTPMMFLPGVIVSMWGGQARSLADNLDIKLDEVRQRVEPWYTPERIDCTMMTVEPGQMGAVRFATEGVREGKPVITLEHVTRLTTAAAPTGSFHRRVTPVCTASSWRGNRGWRSTPMCPIRSSIPPMPAASRRPAVPSMRSTGCVARRRALSRWRTFRCPRRCAGRCGVSTRCALPVTAI